MCLEGCGPGPLLPATSGTSGTRGGTQLFLILKVFVRGMKPDSALARDAPCAQGKQHRLLEAKRVPPEPSETVAGASHLPKPTSRSGQGHSVCERLYPARICSPKRRAETSICGFPIVGMQEKTDENNSYNNNFLTDPVISFLFHFTCIFTVLKA